MPTWQVLLIGGSSGTGKTVLAHRLARRFGVALTQVDDVRLAMQRVTTPPQQPDLHFFLSTPGVWQRPADELRDHLIEVGRAVSRTLEVVIAHHLATPYRLILEGDGIVPQLAAQSNIGGYDAARVRSLFLSEPTEAGLLANMQERGRGLEAHETAEQVQQARMNWLYGQWLAEQARHLGLPVLSTQPRDTIVQRVVDTLA